MILPLLALLATLAYGAGWFRARVVAAQDIPLNSLPRDHGLLAAFVSVTTALLAYIALVPLLPVIGAWIAIGLGVAATTKILFQISPEFRARKLFDWLVSWMFMAASAAIVMITVGIGLSTVFEKLQYIH